MKTSDRRKNSDRRSSPYFRFMIDHIDKTWFKLRDFHYPFAGKDFTDLKNAARIFQEWGVMALWDAFLLSDSLWVKKQGYSVGSFARCLPWLVDAPGWKEKSRIYQDVLVGPYPEPILTLVASENFKVVR